MINIDKIAKIFFAISKAILALIIGIKDKSLKDQVLLSSWNRSHKALLTQHAGRLPLSHRPVLHTTMFELTSSCWVPKQTPTPAVPKKQIPMYLAAHPLPPTANGVSCPGEIAHLFLFHSWLPSFVHVFECWVTRTLPLSGNSKQIREAGMIAFLLLGRVSGEWRIARRAELRAAAILELCPNCWKPWSMHSTSSSSILPMWGSPSPGRHTRVGFPECVCAPSSLPHDVFMHTGDTQYVPWWPPELGTPDYLTLLFLHAPKYCVLVEAFGDGHLTFFLYLLIFPQSHELPM